MMESSGNRGNGKVKLGMKRKYDMGDESEGDSNLGNVGSGQEKGLEEKIKKKSRIVVVMSERRQKERRNNEEVGKISS